LQDDNRRRKYEGKTSPQIIFSDPDHFFWAVEKDIFKRDGVLALSSAMFAPILKGLPKD